MLASFKQKATKNRPEVLATIKLNKDVELQKANSKNNDNLMFMKILRKKSFLIFKRNKKFLLTKAYAADN